MGWAALLNEQDGSVEVSPRSLLGTFLPFSQPRATGVDADGKSAKEEKMLQSLEGMLQGLESTGMTLPNKMRLIAIFIISQVPTDPLTLIHYLRHDDPD